MTWTGRLSSRFGGWKPTPRDVRKRHREHRRSRPSVEGLEGRIVLSTVSDGGTSTLTIDLANNETLGIQSEGSTYDFTLGGSGTFSDGGVANSGDFSGFGTSTLVLDSAGIAHYSTINISDADVSVGATATTVTCSTAGPIHIRPASTSPWTRIPSPRTSRSTRRRSPARRASTSRRPAASRCSRAGSPPPAATSRMNAGTAGTMPTGIADLIEAPITSTGGAISITGTGGTDVNNDDSGVLMENGGLVTSGSGPVTIDGTAGADQFGGQAGVIHLPAPRPRLRA